MSDYMGTYVCMYVWVMKSTCCISAVVNIYIHMYIFLYLVLFLLPHMYAVLHPEKFRIYGMDNELWEHETNLLAGVSRWIINLYISVVTFIFFFFALNSLFWKNFVACCWSLQATLSGINGEYCKKIMLWCQMVDFCEYLLCLK